MKNLKKFFNGVVTVSSVFFMLMCFGNIEKDIYPFLSLMGAIASMIVLLRQAYLRGWLYKCFYEEEE